MSNTDTDTNIDIITEKKNKGSLYWFKCTGEYNWSSDAAETEILTYEILQ